MSKRKAKPKANPTKRASEPTAGLVQPECGRCERGDVFGLICSVAVVAAIVFLIWSVFSRCN
jgi:hypothetical protein